MESNQNISSSSIIDLKAELFRKQEELKQQKLKSDNASYIKSKATEKKPTFWSKQNAGVLARAQKDIENKTEEEDEYEKSRKALERKTKLYEKISKGKDISEEDGSKIYLVDFQKKAIENIREERARKHETESSQQEDDMLSNSDIPPPQTEGEEWVDYTDSLGRSRRCMRKDLPHLIKRDQNLQGKSDSLIKEEDTVMPSLMSDDMRKEMLRQKWEKEELEAMNGPIHYSNVRFDEIRSHGVGFFEFDKSDTTRQEQLDMLNQMRKQTIEERSKKEKIKEKRKAMLDARLAKVKQRKLQREGGCVDPAVLKEETEEEIGPKLDEMVPPKPTEPEPLTRDETIKQNKPVREWDKGKEKMFPPTSEERYFEERRQERLQEFAPPTALYSEQPKYRERKQEKPTSLNSEQSNYYAERKYEKPKEHNQAFNINARNNIPVDKIDLPVVSEIPLPMSKNKHYSDRTDCDPEHDISNRSLLPPNFDPAVPPPFVASSQPHEHLGIYPATSTNQWVTFASNENSANIQYPTFAGESVHSVIQIQEMTASNVAHVQNFSPAAANLHYPQGPDLVQYLTPVQYQQVPNSNIVYGNVQQSSSGNTPTDSSYSVQSTITQNPSASTSSGYGVPPAQAPKPKVNIIDPRFIQNRDVLSQNPGNMSYKKDDNQEDTTESESNIMGSATKGLGLSEDGTFTGKPVVYK